MHQNRLCCSLLLRKVKQSLTIELMQCSKAMLD
jgi:hypothetical protein